MRNTGLTKTQVVKPDARKEYADLVSNKIPTALVSHVRGLCEHIFKHSVNGMLDFNINIITGNIYIYKKNINKCQIYRYENIMSTFVYFVKTQFLSRYNKTRIIIEHDRLELQTNSVRSKSKSNKNK